MTFLPRALARPGRRIAGVATAVSLAAAGGVAVSAPSFAGTTTAASATTSPHQVVSHTVRTSTSRSLPSGAKVRLVAAGWKKSYVTSTSWSVGAVLSAHGVHRDSNDLVYIGPATWADRREGAVAQITVKRVTATKKTTRKLVHYKTVTRHDAHRYASLGKVLQRSGRNGVRTTVQSVTLVDGKVSKRRTVSVRSTARDRVVVVGTRKTPRKATVAYSRAVGREMVRRKGWSTHQYTCLVSLWNRESGWRVSAHNASSGAWGIPQALPGNKMSTKGTDWKTNPKTQISWGLGYIKGRYGSPCGALAHSHRSGWY
ncbi:G5 domain-containing protein [Luteimicrobium subarcticum]|uniref:Surface rod structure-forming protein G n=1 Tax=Luteimicrobium subarcticum TaxID=620910 RepID=A0A2M8WT24_9MICO|nr:G5 domain-containing protein [Luteimicrobium subarcticum]PJI94069.1 surface rod structure-forming protein G [Luteimicrobium subarcticum]